jgi:membrane protein
MNPKAFFRLLRKSFQEWQQDKAPRLGAALAYHAMFSIAPLVVVAIAVAGLVFGDEAARGEIARQLQTAIGKPAAEAVEDLIKHTRQVHAGILASLIGFGTLLFGAAAVFWQLQDALNTIWKVAPRPGRTWLMIVRDRFLSFLLVLGGGFFLLLLLAVSTTLVALSHFFDPELPGGLSLWHIVNDIVSVLTITVLFAMIYKFLPDVKIAWGDVWLGSAFTALLFTFGKFLLSLYLGYTSVTSAFGAAGSLVLILFWIYYSAQIFLFGAEFIRVFAGQRGGPVVPRTNAVLLTLEDRVRQGIPRKEDIEGAMRTAEMPDQRKS